jgi:hypothetical protein
MDADTRYGGVTTLPVDRTLIVTPIVTPIPLTFTTVAPAKPSRFVMGTAGTAVDLLGHRNVARGGENACRVAKR